MDKLRFYTNKQLDEIITEQFFNERGGGINFGEGIVNLHPKLKPVRLLKDTAQKKKAIHLYFNHYYRVHRVAISRSIQHLRQSWYKREKEFITVTKNFFGGFQFPKGKYIAYASIINCNPRFLDSKTFQFFYKKPVTDAVHTIAHELLHFIFFDFVKKKFKNEIKKLSEDQLWDFSEIFNVVVLESSRYQHIIDKQYVIPYPDHKRFLFQFRKLYKNSRDAEKFIRHSIDLIETKR